MKKVLLFAVLAMFLMVPMSFAKQAISDSDLAGVTAQEGVTIDFSCFTLGSIGIEVSGWGDSDGCATCGDYTAAGWVGMNKVTIPTVTLTGSLTIDVGTKGAVTALIIGLPGVSLAGNMLQTLVLGTSAADLADGSTTQVLGTAYMTGLTLNPTGALIIHAH